MTWTDERVELLKKLWIDGLSASQIAAEMGGVTRNAVIGKVHRLGLSGRAKTANSASSRPKPAPRNTNFQARPARNGQQRGLVRSRIRVSPERRADGQARVEQRLEAPEPLRLELTDLTDQTCKWPIGDPAAADFSFCGHAPKEGSPYCPYHSRVAYQPVLDRRRDRYEANG